MIEQVQPLSGLRDPVLITAFAMRRRGGRQANTALGSLIEAWQAQLVAKIDPDGFVDFTVRRPDIRADGDTDVIDWPETRLYLGRPAEADRDFLLLTGFEPSFRWQAFVESLTEYADSVGVKTLVNLRSQTARVPHTRPPAVTVAASDLELELMFGVQAGRAQTEEEADIATILSTQVQSLRWRTADLTVMQPDYLPRMSYLPSSVGLIRLIDKAFGTETAVAALAKQAEEQTREISESIANSLEARSTIQELEQQYDEGVEKLDFLSPSDVSRLPSGSELAEEIERHFREGGTF